MEDKKRDDINKSPIDMYKGKQRSVEIYEYFFQNAYDDTVELKLVAVGGMKDFIYDSNIEGTDHAKAILSLKQGQSTNVVVHNKRIRIRRNDNV